MIAAEQWASRIGDHTIKMNAKSQLANSLKGVEFDSSLSAAAYRLLPEVEKMNDMFPHSAKLTHDLFEAEQRSRKIFDEAGKAMQKHREIQEAGAKASVESHKLLKQQLAEQTEINQRLEHEFKMGAREAVITRRIAYWSLAVGIAGILITVIALVKSVWG